MSLTFPAAEEPKDVEPAEVIDETNNLRRTITTRQLVFMALGGSIGAGLFVASGGALSSGGPASLLLNFGIVGLMVCTTMGALGELATSFPVAGAFYDYTVRFVNEPWGFAMGWTFAANWLLVLPFELTIIGVQLQYWKGDLHPAMFIAPFLLVLSVISFKGSKWFGELEHFLGVTKVAAIVAFIFMGVIIASGGVSSDTREPKPLGFHYWTNNGAFRNGFGGFLAVFRVAGMSYGGTELLGMTARECINPRRAMPIATKLVFGRIFFFYFGTLFILGLIVPADDPHLASSGEGAQPSPLALAADLANIKGMGHYFNATIVLALVSMANTSIFAASRTLQALCTKGMGPKAFSRVSKRLGVPIWSTMVCICFGFLGFINCAPDGAVIFDWLLSISGTANYFIWAGICISHIRFRQAWKARGRDTKDLIWRNPFGVPGSVLGVMTCAFALFANVLGAIFPEKGKPDCKTIIRENAGMLIPPLLYLGYIAYFYIRRRNLQRSIDAGTQRIGDASAVKPMPYLFFIPLDEIDIDQGRLSPSAGTPLPGRQEAV